MLQITDHCPRAHKRDSFFLGLLLLRRETSRYPYKGPSWIFIKLGLAQSREDPPGLTKCLGLLKIGPLEVLFKYLNFHAKNISKYKLLHSRVDPTQKV